MNNDDKKMIIFLSDVDENKSLGNLVFVKFLDVERKLATFYNPLVAPKDFKDYIARNRIETAYELTDDTLLERHDDKIYTFIKDNGIYKVTKGIELETKRILLVDKGMNLELDMPKYSYELINDSFHLSPLKEGVGKSFCYVEDDCKVPAELKKIMLPVVEAIPGILSVNSYPFIPVSRSKKMKNPYT